VVSLVGAGSALSGCAQPGTEALGRTAQAIESTASETSDENLVLPGGDEIKTSTHQTLFTTQELGCHEVIVLRGASIPALQAFVPARYTLNLITPTIGRMFIIDYTCDAVSVDGRGSIRRTSVTLVSTTVSARDGAPVNAQYILGFGTDNPQLAARFRQLGLPEIYLPQTTATDVLRVGGAQSDIEWKFAADEPTALDHRLWGVTTEPPAAPIEYATSTYYFDGPDGDVRLSYFNSRQPVSTAVISADFRAASLIMGYLYLPTLGQINNVRFTFIRGGWTSTAEHI